MTELVFQKKWLNSSCLETKPRSSVAVFSALFFQPPFHNFVHLLKTISNTGLGIPDLNFILILIVFVFLGTQTIDNLSVRLRTYKETSNRVIIYRSCLLCYVKKHQDSQVTSSELLGHLGLLQNTEGEGNMKAYQLKRHLAWKDSQPLQSLQAAAQSHTSSGKGQQGRTQPECSPCHLACGPASLADMVSSNNLHCGNVFS